MASASMYPALEAVKTLHKTGEWANYFKEGDAATIEQDYLQVSLVPIPALANAIAAVKAATLILNNAADNIWRQHLEQAQEKEEQDVEEELGKGKRSVRKQIEKGKAVVDKFSSDPEVRRTAADASPKLPAMWDKLKHAHQAENDAGEKAQDCYDKYPKTSELIQRTKWSMNAKVNFPALFEGLIIVTKLDSEWKGLPKVANDAKASRLAAEKKLTGMGMTLDPSSAYVRAPSFMPVTPSRVANCY